MNTAKKRTKRTFKFKIEKDSEINNVLRCMREQPKPLSVSIAPFKADRSLAQNKLAFQWYSEIADSEKEGRGYIRNYCKFSFGCERLINQEQNKGDRAFPEFYENIINTLTYEQCIDAMEFVQVTSMMKVKAFTLYLEDIEQYAAGRDMRLTHPDDLYWEAMGVKP